MKKAKSRLHKKRNRKRLIKPVLLVLSSLFVFSLYPTKEPVSPYISSAFETTVIEEKEIVNEVELIAEGVSSYYSEKGCLGCSPTLTMHNGERFHDENVTMALVPEMYYKYKNQYLTVLNKKTNQKVSVKVTDSGGFGRYDRVADLSPATKDAIGCNDLCTVSIYKE